MVYKFIGNGMGVPGLPHEISDEEAKRLGVGELLAEAIQNGWYEPCPPAAEAASPQMSTFGGKKKSEKGVNNG